jgi:hypothetical protein
VHLPVPNADTPNPGWLAVPVALSIAIAAWLARRPRVAVAPLRRSSPPGVQPGRSQRRRGERVSSLAGHVRDATTGLPLTAARVCVRDAHGPETTVPIADDGSFRSRELSPGVCALHVSAPGYADVQATLAIPHAGESSNLRVALLSFRVLALDALQPLAARVLLEKARARVATARETLLYARRRQLDTAALEVLTEQIEHVAYAETTPTRGDVEAITASATAVATELDTSAGAAPAKPLRGTTPRWEQ